MNKHYAGVIHQDEGSDYGISFPDFPGCISAGADIDEVYEMGREALALHVEGMVEDGEAVPEPSRLSDVKASPEHSDAKAIILVPVDVPLTNAKRINVSLPDLTLRRVDAYAKGHGVSRSSLLARAAESYISTHA